MTSPTLFQKSSLHILTMSYPGHVCWYFLHTLEHLSHHKLPTSNISANYIKRMLFFAPELGIKYDLTSHIKVLKMLNFNFDGKRTVTHPYHILNLIHSMENKVQLCHIPNFLSSKGPGKRDFILCCSCDNTSMISLKLPHKL